MHFIIIVIPIVSEMKDTINLLNELRAAMCDILSLCWVLRSYSSELGTDNGPAVSRLSQ